MRTHYVVGIGLAIGLGVAAWASQSPDSPEIKTLADAEEKMFALTLRVATLEARLEKLENNNKDAGPSGAGMPVAAAPHGSPIMRVESLELVKPDEATTMRIEQLGAEAEALEQQAASLGMEASSVTIPTINDGSRLAAQRRLDLLRNQTNEAKREARQKRDEIKKLSAPRQIIRGWSGKKSVELRTERDLSQSLSKVVVGSFITCTGTRIDADDDSATLLVTSIAPVAAPANFVERPATSK